MQNMQKQGDTYLFTSEAVSPGHPDKVADQISDALLDDFLKHDATARVAIETLVTAGHVTLAGEFRSHHTPDYAAIVRQTIRDIGYTPDVQADFNHESVAIENYIHGQSPEIAQGVDAGDRTSEGAGDQGIMFGYATNETPAYMPAPLYYSHKILEHLRGQPGLLPDAKSQLTFEYSNGVPQRVHTLLVSHQHRAETAQDDIKAMVLKTAAELMGDLLDAETRVLVNPTGSFTQGGPGCDTGLTGRKIIVDTYGGMARHGGGAFSGKDPTKVDRSGAYAARYLAKNVVAQGLAQTCEIQLCYAIGVAEPLAVYVNTFGTAAPGLTDAALATKVQQAMDLTPRGMREHLGLNQPLYLQTAKQGHFGHSEFPWEGITLSI